MTRRVVAQANLGFAPQRMVRWLGPRGLATTALQVLLSTIFGAYSDKREIQAALQPSGELDFSDRNELWFDFLADTGDGFDPTYATARLLREDLELTHDGVAHRTQKGELVVLGGDMAYPAATPTSYHDRFVGPYAAAFPEPEPGEPRPTMVACAGNHDWYDGLTTFLRLFCQGKDVGGWTTRQTRSYFTLRLPHGWWVMGIDLAFDFFIDEPQMAYFRHEASQRMQPGDKVILMTHRPSWLFSAIGDDQLYTPSSMTNLQQFEHDVIHANGLDMPLVLAGDIHHYNRYASDENGRQRITSGGGAAFLYPTSHLAEVFRWPDEEGPTSYDLQAVYPDAKTSRRLRWGTLLAPFLNPSFIVFVGSLYLLVALLIRFSITGVGTVAFTKALRATSPGDVAQIVFGNPGTFVFAVGLAAIMVVFADAPSVLGRFVVGLVHFAFQFCLLVVVIWGMARIILAAPIDAPYLKTTAFIAGVGAGGGYLGSQLFALYLFVMFSVFGRHATHAFSSQHIANYRNFLRLRIGTDGALTIYAIAVDKVPRRWRVARGRTDGASVFEPADRTTECHLVEPPIHIPGHGHGR